MKNILALIVLIMSQGIAYATPKQQYAIGYQFSWPTSGVSGKYRIDNRVSVQAELGILGNYTSFWGRANYMFRNKTRWNLYGFGGTGIITTVDDGLTTVGLKGGAGIEYNLQAVEPEFPPVWVNFEMGLTYFDTDSVKNPLRLGYGLGFHYYFDL